MRWHTLGAAAALVVLAAPARADSPLERVPADAPVVLHLRGWDRAQERLRAMITTAVRGPEGEALARLVLGPVDELLAGRRVRGVARDGSVMLVLAETPALPLREPPKLALLVQVENYTAFRDGLLSAAERETLERLPAGYETARVAGQDVYLAQADGYAVITLDRRTAGLLKARPARHLARAFAPEIERRFAEADVALLVNLPPIAKAHGKAMRELAAKVRSDAQERAKDTGWPEGLAEFMPMIFGGLFQLVEDSKAALLTATFEPAGLKVHLQVQVNPGTASGAFLKELAGPLSDFRELDRLPAGLLSYGATAPGAAENPLPEVLKQLTGGTTPSQKAAVEVIKLRAEARKRVEVSAQNARMMASGIWVTTADDPAKLAEAEAKDAQSGVGDALLKRMYKQLPTPGPEKTYRGFTLRNTSWTYDLGNVAEMSGISTRGLRSLSGEGNAQWCGTDGKVFVKLVAPDWDRAREYLDAYLDGRGTLGDQEGYRAMRRNLPAKASMLNFEDLTHFFQHMARFTIANVAGLNGIPESRYPRVPRPGGGPPQYYGWTATNEERRLAVDLWVPGFALAEGVRVMGGVFDQMKGK